MDMSAVAWREIGDDVHLTGMEKLTFPPAHTSTQNPKNALHVQLIHLYYQSKAILSLEKKIERGDGDGYLVDSEM
jgi:hypothetical protein